MGLISTDHSGGYEPLAFVYGPASVEISPAALALNRPNADRCLTFGNDRTGQDYGPPKPGPNAQFVLQPSSGSAFCLLPPYNKPAVLWPAARSPSPLSLEAPAGSDMQ